MKAILPLTAVTCLLLISVSPLPSSSSVLPREVNNEQAKDGTGSVWLPARTECCPGRKATIAPVPLHPVIDVLVAPGDRVSKDQALVRLDDDEPQADVRNKKALAESAKIVLEEADRYLKKAEEMFRDGVYAEARYFAARTAAQKALQDERAAVAALESTTAELEHYEIQAPIDGVVCWLEVCPGMVSRPGTTVWGEIMDLSEIDVRCEVSLDQVDKIKVGQIAQVRQTRKNGVLLSARVVMVGIRVDAATGLVTVVARVANGQNELRCGEAVQICFTEADKGK